LMTPASNPANPGLIELGELFTFVGRQKTRSTLLREFNAKRAASRAGHSDPLSSDNRESICRSGSIPRALNDGLQLGGFDMRLADL
jgi:hypothetical protein